MAMMVNPAVPKEEQETVTQISREGENAVIYTTDTRVINRLDKKYSRTKVYRSSRMVCAVEYDVPARCVSFRGLTKRASHDDE